jgi:hypothetical protein
MTAFAFGELVPAANDVISSALGTATGTNTGIYSSNDVGRAVMLGANSNHIDATSGADIDGFITSIEPWSVNGGYSFGGVMQEGRKVVTAGGAIAIGAMVVAGTQPAIATAPSVGSIANYNNGANTQAVVIAGSPTHAFWRCISNVTNPGSAAVAGNLVLIERV